MTFMGRSGHFTLFLEIMSWKLIPVPCGCRLSNMISLLISGHFMQFLAKKFLNFTQLLTPLEWSLEHYFSVQI